MALNFSYYGMQAGETPAARLAEANSYFAQRLHEVAWSAATDADKEKALIAARGVIDALNFKGSKAAVYAANAEPGSAAALAAEASQPLEFPRGADIEVPEAIRIAGYEVAYALLDGKDAELELENLAVSAMGYAGVRTSYDRTGLPVEHIINMVPSSVAWRLLRPFLRDSDALKLSRLS